MKMLFLLLILTFSTAVHSQGRTRNCKNCVELTQCQYFTNLLKQPSLEVYQQLRTASCGYKKTTPLVCCPNGGLKTEPDPKSPEPSVIDTAPQQSLLPSSCGRVNTLNRIINGEEVALGVFTWMVAFGYSVKGHREVEFMCGGSLISNRYVLTAAHCLDPSSQLLQHYDFVQLNIGDWNLKTDPDCQTFRSLKYCAPSAEIRSPASIIIHEDYNTRSPHSDDIGLVRLDRPVQFHEFIEPLCLPPRSVNVKRYLTERVTIVAGWGINENGTASDILQQLDVPYFDKEQCSIKFRRQLNEKQICFGGIDNRDSCNGDSGGPVIESNVNGPPFSIIGIVSFGPPVCGIKNFPAVYTSVPDYVDWIHSKLRP